MKEFRRRIDVGELVERSAARSGEFDAARSRTIAKLATNLELAQVGARGIRRSINVGEAHLHKASTMEAAAFLAGEITDLREQHRIFIDEAAVPRTLPERTEFVSLLIESSRISADLERKLRL